MKKIGVLLIGVIASSVYAQPCQDYKELLKTGHMHIGVKFDTNNADVVKYGTSAMNYWATILDFDWYITYGSDCAIEFRPEQFAPRFHKQQLGGALLPEYSTFDGVLHFQYGYVPYNMEKCFRHELGHLFGLHHREDTDSVMYPNSDEGSGLLTAQDIRAVQRLHLLKESQLAKN